MDKKNPTLLKRIQIDFVLLVACNYFYIIYRFARAVEIEKQSEIYAMPPYTVGGVRTTPEEKILESGKMMPHRDHHSLRLVCPIEKLLFLLARKKYERETAGKCMNNETVYTQSHKKVFWANLKFTETS